MPSTKEVVLYGTIATFWWLSSASVLLPFVLLLKFSKTFRDRWFSFLFVRILGPIFGPVNRPLRKRTFELLKEHLAKEQFSSKSPIEILEIGIGGGANLEYYPENSVLTALDMNESFDTYYRENKKKYPHITYKRTIHAMAENMSEIPNSSMDVVISTHVLCSIEDLKLVLAEIKRVLKPGGKYAFLEHVAFPKSEWSYLIQKLLSPLWKIYFDGCMIHRDIADSIQKAGFSHVIVERKFPKDNFFYIRPQIIGVAIK